MIYVPSTASGCAVRLFIIMIKLLFYYYYY